MKLQIKIFFCEWANKVFTGSLLTGVDLIKELDNVYNTYFIYGILT
jgi:hypothetical protein